MTDYYKSLEVSKTASEAEIKKAYRRLAVRYHPDKISEEQRARGEEKFKEISEAYAVLSDPEKRQIYDRHGIEGLKQHERMSDMSGGFPFPFNFGPPQQNKRVPFTSHQIHLDLDAFYFGKLISFKLNIKNCCLACHGTGCSDSSKVEKCSTCQGRGQVTRQSRIGPGFIAQQVVQCPNCHGKGESYPKQYICQPCQGTTQVSTSTVVEYYVKKGTDYGDYVIPNKGDYVDSNTRGHIRLQIRPPKAGSKYPFKRGDDQLFYEHHLTLKEALLGFDLTIRHIDPDRPIRLISNEVISSGSIREIENRGMPKLVENSSSPDTYGSMVIIFRVDFPTTEELNANPESKKLLNQALMTTKSRPRSKYQGPTPDQSDTYRISELKQIDPEKEMKEQQHQIPEGMFDGSENVQECVHQ